MLKDIGDQLFAREACHIARTAHIVGPRDETPFHRPPALRRVQRRHGRTRTVMRRQLIAEGPTGTWRGQCDGVLIASNLRDQTLGRQALADAFQGGDGDTVYQEGTQEYAEAGGRWEDAPQV